MGAPAQAQLRIARALPQQLQQLGTEDAIPRCFVGQGGGQNADPALDAIVGKALLDAAGQRQRLHSSRFRVAGVKQHQDLAGATAQRRCHHLA